MVRALCFHCWGQGSVPGWGTKSPQTVHSIVKQINTFFKKLLKPTGEFRLLSINCTGLLAWHLIINTEPSFTTHWCQQMCVLSSFSPVRLFATPWTVALQAPLSMGFSRQEYGNGLPCRPPGDLPDQGSDPGLLKNCRQILYHLSHQGSLMSVDWQAQILVVTSGSGSGKERVGSGVT